MVLVQTSELAWAATMTGMPARQRTPELFKGLHFDHEVVILCVRWYLSYKLSSRDLVNMMGERSVELSTDSRHDFEVAINVARRLIPTAINQLWVADITYVRLGRVDVFLAVVMDAFSRRIVGWNLAPKITTELALVALRNAIESRQPAPGLIHHSDRGVQYASAAYVDTLLQHGMIPSMSRAGNPYDNAYASHCTSSRHCGRT